MRVKLFLLFIVLCPSAAWSQVSSLDRLRARLAELGATPVDESGKCGTPLILDAMQRMQNAPPGVLSGLQEALQRPTTHLSRLSPSGRFRIHYDTTGTHEPAMITGVPASRVPNSYEEYVDSVGSVFDQVWNKEVAELGYGSPPADNGMGGGNEYDVYVQSQSTGDFGFTSWEPADSLESGARQRYPTYVTIDIDFLGERTPGLDGLRVTAAHEFHHAIQVGSYGIWSNVPSFDFFFYELCAVWLEEVVYDDINDYYFDLDNFFLLFKDFANRSFGFTQYSIWRGYERSVWALYLEKKYGRDIILEIWDRIKQMPVLQSMDETLQLRGNSLASSFAEFGAWNLFTGFRADSVRYYDEGKNFPLMSMNASTMFVGATSVINGSGLPLSLQYYRFELPGDTVIAVIANTNATMAYSAASQTESFSLSLGSGPMKGTTQKLKNGLTMGFDTEMSSEWRTRYVGMTLSEDLRQESFPSPNPIQLSRADLLTLPVDPTAEGPVEVFFLTPSMDLAYTGTHVVVNRFGKSEVLVPTSALRPYLSSGVHFVHLKTKDREYIWKVVVIR